VAIRKIIKSLLPKSVLRWHEAEFHKETHINRALQRARRPTRYIEIGAQYGTCIQQIVADHRIAVDPSPMDLESPNWDGVTVRCATSDQYFAEVADSELGAASVDAALVDGLHEFRQALRDILNLERFMTPLGVIFIHDCNPPTRSHAEEVTGAWNGDVWKVAWYLRRYRPDLNYCTLDCDWGLGMVSGFSKSAPPPDDSMIERVAALDYDFLASDRKSVLKLRSPVLGAWLLPRRQPRSRF